MVGKVFNIQNALNNNPMNYDLAMNPNIYNILVDKLWVGFRAYNYEIENSKQSVIFLGFPQLKRQSSSRDSHNNRDVYRLYIFDIISINMPPKNCIFTHMRSGPQIEKGTKTNWLKDLHTC